MASRTDDDAALNSGTLNEDRKGCDAFRFLERLADAGRRHYADFVVPKRLSAEELDARLTKVVPRLVRAMNPDMILLFGSFARGDHNRASDIDLIVIADSEEPFLERVGRALEAAVVAPRPSVDVLVYTPAEWERMRRTRSTFTERIESEGRVVYEREPQSDGSRTLASAS